METTENKKLKKSVKIRLQKEADKKWKSDNAGKLGETKAALRNVPTSPRKMRLVADMIRGQRVNVAINMLKFENKHASNAMEKLLLTAIADWQNINSAVKIEEADLIVKEVFVDGGRILKRLRPAPQGRAHRIRKRSNHITMVIADSNSGNESVTEKETENK